MSEQEERAEGRQDQAKARSVPWLAIAIAGAVLVVCVGNLAKGDDQDDDVTYQAESTCEDWVEDRLKAPATADVSTSSTLGSGRGPWTFSGTVDAENSFGAKIRSDWKCEIELAGETFTGSAQLVN